MVRHITAIFAAFIGVLLPIACGGGGGGGGGGKPVDPGFVVQAVEPGTGAVNQPNDVSVRAILTAPVEGISVTEQSFFVTPLGSTVPQPGVREVSADGYRIVFHPDPWFEVSTRYVIHVTPLLHGRDGKALATEYLSNFQTSSWPSPDPVKQVEWKEVVDPMGSGRSRHTSTLIGIGGGLVLLAGGYSSGTTVTNTAELFEPTSGLFFPATGRLANARANHTATLLESGFVLVAGGEKLDPNGLPVALASTELFAVGSTTFVASPAMHAARSVHTATLLADGRVLITGGDVFDLNGYPQAQRTAEIYTPTPFPGSWAATANDMEVTRSGHQATVLEDGRVLITGGTLSKVAEIFDPVTDRFSRTRDKLTHERWRHGAVRLASGRVLITDGGSQLGEIFDPATEDFTETASADSVSRYAALTFEFRPGEALILGGFSFLDGGGILLHATMEQFVEDYGPYGEFFQIMPFPPRGVYLRDTRAYSAVSPLGDGRFLISGGLGPSYDGPDLNTAVLFDPSAN